MVEWRVTGRSKATERKTDLPEQFRLFVLRRLYPHIGTLIEVDRGDQGLRGRNGTHSRLFDLFASLSLELSYCLTHASPFQFPEISTLRTLCRSLLHSFVIRCASFLFVNTRMTPHELSTRTLSFVVDYHTVLDPNTIMYL
jgi:hypothetical protein